MASSAVTDLLAIITEKGATGSNALFLSVKYMLGRSSIWLDEFKQRKEKGHLEDLQTCYYEDVSIDEQGRDDEGKNMEEYLLAYEPDANTLDLFVQDIHAFVSKVSAFVSHDPILTHIFEVPEGKTLVLFRKGFDQTNTITLSILFRHIVNPKYPSLESYAAWLLGRLHYFEEEKKRFNRQMAFYEYVYFYLWIHKRSARKNREGFDIVEFEFEEMLAVFKKEHNFSLSLEE